MRRKARSNPDSNILATQVTKTTRVRVAVQGAGGPVQYTQWWQISVAPTKTKRLEMSYSDWLEIFRAYRERQLNDGIEPRR